MRRMVTKQEIENIVGPHTYHFSTTLNFHGAANYKITIPEEALPLFNDELMLITLYVGGYRSGYIIQVRINGQDIDLVHATAQANPGASEIAFTHITTIPNTGAMWVYLDKPYTSSVKVDITISNLR